MKDYHSAPINVIPKETRALVGVMHFGVVQVYKSFQTFALSLQHIQGLAHLQSVALI